MRVNDWYYLSWSFGGIINQVFIPDSWHRAPKTLGICCLLYVNEMTHGGTLGSFRMGAGCHKENICAIRGLEYLAPPPPLPPGGERRWKLRLITIDYWFNQLWLHNETSIKPLNDEVWRASWLVNTSGCWEGGMPGEGMETPYNPSPYLALCISSTSLFLSYILYYKPVILSKALSWVL